MQYDDTLIFNTQIDNRGAEEGLSKLDAFTANFSANIASQITGAIGSALAQIPAQVTEIGKQFESSMSQVAATMGISQVSEDFELLSQTAKEMGETTKFSASQAGDALNYLALAGYDANQACTALPTVLDLAAAGGIDLARASDMVTDSMSALGLEMDELDGFVDQMAVTSQKSNTSVEQLGSAILSAGANARILKGGTVELMTELGILADSGLKSAEAGTALNRVIKNLSTPTSAARDELERLGVQAYDSSGEFRNMQDIFRDLDSAMSGFTDRQKQEALNNIFDTAALSSAKVLLSQCGERFDELSGYIDNAEGAASQMADTMSDNLAGDLTTCQSAAEGLANTLYEEFSGTARTAVQSVTEVIGELNDSIKDGELKGSVETLAAAFSETLASSVKFLAEDIIPAAIKGFTLIVEHGKDIISVAAGIAAGFAAWKIGTVIQGVSTALAGATAATAALSAAQGGASITALALGGNLTAAQIAAALFTGDITLATAAQAAFNLVCDANPILLVAAALAGLVTGIGLFINALDDGEEEISEYAKEMDKLRSKEDDIVKSSEKDIAVLKRKEERYEELRKKYDSLNENEMTEFLGLCEELQEVMPEGTSLIDEQTGAYNDLAGSIDKVIERMRMEALLEAKKETYKTALVQKDEINGRIAAANAGWETDEGIGALSTWTALAGSENIEDAKRYYLDFYFRDTYGMSYDAAVAALGEADKSIAEYEKLEKDFFSQKPAADSKNPDEEGQDDSGTKEPAVTIKPEVREYETTSAAVSKKSARRNRREEEQQRREDEEFEEKWADLDYKRQMGYIATDAELYAKRLELYKQYGDDSRKEHNKYRLDIKNLGDKITETERKTAEDQAAEAERQRKEAEKQREEAEKQREEEEKRKKQAPIDSLDNAFSDADWEFEQSDKSLDALEKRNNAKKAAWDKYGDENRKDMRRFITEMKADGEEYTKAVAAENEALSQTPINSLDAAFAAAEHDYLYDKENDPTEALKKRAEAYRAAWDEFGDESRADMDSYYSKVLSAEADYNDTITKQDEEAAAERERIAEEESEAAIKAREDEWTAIARLERNGIIDTEKALQMRKEWIEKYCPEYSEEWYDYYQTVYDMEVTAAEDALAARKAYLNDELSEVKENLNAVLSEYKSKYGEIQSNISSYKSKLLNAAGSAFSIEETENPDGSKTRTYRVANIRKQIEAMQKLHETLSKMKADGASMSLIQEILSMEPEDGLQMAEYLINSGDLAGVDALYKQRDAAAQAMAEEFYSDDIAELNAETANDIIAAYDGLPEEMQAIGAAAVTSLLTGMSSASGDISAYLGNEIDNMLAGANGYVNGLAADKPEYFDNAAANTDVSVDVDANTPDMTAQGKSDGEAYAAGFAEGAGNISADIPEEVKTDISAEVNADVSQKNDSTAAEYSFIEEFRTMMSEGFAKLSSEFAKIVDSVSDINVHSTHATKLLLDGKKVAESVNDYNEKLGRIADI